MSNEVSNPHYVFRDFHVTDDQVCKNEIILGYSRFVSIVSLCS